MFQPRRLALGAACALALAAAPVFAETPRDSLVMALQIDDLITLDPAEVFEFSGAEYAAIVWSPIRSTTSRTCAAMSPRAGRSPTTAGPIPSRSGTASRFTAAIRSRPRTPRGRCSA